VVQDKTDRAAARVVVAGAAGILGSAFMTELPPGSTSGLGSADLDASAPTAATRLVVALAPSVIINCAADTDVEGAEIDDSRARAVNIDLARALAEAARETGARFVHFSSTGCYGNWKSTPYEDGDPLRPTTAHHRSKALGEEAVLGALPTAVILRLGWVFGGQPGQRKNFVWARLREAAGKVVIGSDPSQIGSPTSAADVVVQVAHLLSSGDLRGLFNCAGGGLPASRLDYVAAILAAAGSETRVEPAAFQRRAAVSANEAALNSRLQTLQAQRMRPWRVALADFVRATVQPVPE
jgi:dTDP-4-dehydrorhamnose reductase